jgi:hypothetical protein
MSGMGIVPSPESTKVVDTLSGHDVGDCLAATIAANMALAGLSSKQGLARDWMDEQARAALCCIAYGYISPHKVQA